MMSSGDALRLCLQQWSQGFTKITNVAITSYQVIYWSVSLLSYPKPLFNMIKGFDVMQMRSMC